MPGRRFRRNIANLASLTCIQVANALLPLAAYPLILGAVGAVRFSRVVVTESVMLVVLAVVIYSFDVEGVSRVAGLDSDKQETDLSAVYSDILGVRLLILGAFGVLLALLYPFVERSTFLLLAGWILFPLSYILQATWFFQGIERNVVPAIAITVSRVACLILVRLLITRPDDFLLAPLIIGGCYAAGGGVLLMYAIMKYRLRLSLVPRARARDALFRGKEIFVGNLSVALYRGSNVLILNAVSTSKAVVVYSIAEKTIKVFQAGAGPLNQVFFPKLVRALSQVTAPSRTVFRSVLRYTMPQLGALCLGAIGIGGAFVLFRGRLPAPFRSEQTRSIIGLVAIMSPAVFFGVANFMFGTGGLNYLGRRAYYATSILATGICNLVCCFALVSLFTATGAAVSYALAEGFLFMLVARAYFTTRPTFGIGSSGAREARGS